MPSKLFSIAIVENLVVSVPICAHLVSLVGLSRVEIHHEQQISLFKHNHLILFVRKGNKLVRSCHCLVLLLNCIHVLVKSVELTET